MKFNKNLYIKLSKLQPIVEKYYSENSQNWRKNSQSETLKYLKQGLIDRAVTRDLDWGIEIPVDGYDKKRMYVWIDAVLGYLTATMKYCEENNLKWEDYWKNNDNTLMYMVHGKDNIIFHSIILPSLLYAMDLNMKLPDKMVSCEYLNINDEKISKSKGNGITILDLTEQYDIDSIRYYFLSNGPEKKDGNFSIEVSAQVATKPVFYGESRDSGLQSYALTGYTYEEGTGSKKVYYTKNETKIIITKTDDKTGKKLEGVEFELLDKDQNKIYTEITTNKDGIATIDNLLPGIYYIKETRTLEGYQLYSKLIKVELELNEETTVNVINSEEEPEIYKEEKKTELAVKEEQSSIKVKETVQKLPKTGM